MSHPNLLGLHPESFTSFLSTPSQPPQTTCSTKRERACMISSTTKAQLRREDSLAIWPTQSLSHSMCQRLGVSERRKCNVWQCKRNDCTYLHPCQSRVPQPDHDNSPHTLHPAPPLRPRHPTPRGPCAILGHWRWHKSDVGGPHKACCLDCLVSAGSWLSHLAEIDGNRIRKTCRIEGRKTCRTWNREHFTVEVRPVFEIGRISGIWQDLVQTQTHSETVVDGRVGVGAHHGQRTHQRGGEGAARPSNGREGRSTSMRMQRIIWNWWRTDWVRVEDFPRPYVLGSPQKKIRKSNHLRVDVQWYWLDEKRKFRRMYFKFRTSQEQSGEIHARALDIPWTWKRRDVVWNIKLPSWRKMAGDSQHDGGNNSRNLDIQYS